MDFGSPATAKRCGSSAKKKMGSFAEGANEISEQAPIEINKLVVKVGVEQILAYSLLLFIHPV